MSLTPDHTAVFTDALAMSWEGIFAYAFPSAADLLTGHPEVQPEKPMSPPSGGPILAQTDVVCRSTKAVGDAPGDSLEGTQNFKVPSVSLCAPEKGFKVSAGKGIYDIDSTGPYTEL